MTPLASLTWIKTKSSFVFLGQNLRTRWLEVLVSASIIGGIFWGGYLLFDRAALFLLQQGELGGLLLDRVFYLGWSIIFYLLILSNIITSFSTLYRSEEVAYLFTNPIPHGQVFQIKFIENALYSSWAILIFGLPLTMVYGKIKLLTPLQTLITLIGGLIPYLIIAAAIGLSITVVAVFVSKWLRMRSIFLFLAIFFALLFWTYFKFGQRDMVLLGEVGNFRAIDRYLLNMSRVPFPLIPSHWFSQVFIQLQQQNWSELFFFGGLLISNALLGQKVSVFLANRYYYQGYQVLESAGVPDRRQDRALTPGLFRFLQAVPIQFRGMVSKDILHFVRTPQQWIQFMLFAFFIGIYLINLTRIDFHLNHFDPIWRILIYVFNFGFTGFVLAALTSRFVFPLISLEGHSLWVLKAAPMPISRLFREKFWLAFLIFFPLTELVALVSNYFLSYTTYATIITTFFLMLMSITLISIAIGLGTVFAQYHEHNPMKIGSSAGGIINVFISLTYVSIMVGALVWLIWQQENGGSFINQIIILLIVLIINVIATSVPLVWGHRSLVKTEL